MTRTKTRNDAEPHYTAERLEDLSTGPLPTFARAFARVRVRPAG